jgi:hypothetical protein
VGGLPLNLEPERQNRRRLGSRAKGFCLSLLGNNSRLERMVRSASIRQGLQLGRRAGSPACAAAARPPRRARRNRPAPPAGRACRWSRPWPRPPFCRGDAAKGARSASAAGPSSTGGARSCRDRPHPTAPLAPRESGSAHGHSDRTRGRLHREISQSLPVQPVVVSEPTRSCCMANSVAAARLETPAFA